MPSLSEEKWGILYNNYHLRTNFELATIPLIEVIFCSFPPSQTQRLTLLLRFKGIHCTRFFLCVRTFWRCLLQDSQSSGLDPRYHVCNRLSHQFPKWGGGGEITREQAILEDAAGRMGLVGGNWQPRARASGDLDPIRCN